MVPPTQTLAAPEIEPALGAATTDIPLLKAVSLQPALVATYIIVTGPPAAMGVTIPVEEPTAAMLGLLDSQKPVPPVVVKVTGIPVHSEVGEDIVPADGTAFTAMVWLAVSEQLPDVTM